MQNFLSGVTSWALELRHALAAHERYNLLLLNLGPDSSDYFDINVPTLEAARRVLNELKPAIIIPNYLFELFLAGFDEQVHCIGMCHADSEKEYYRPLQLCEPVISKFVGVSRECSANLAHYIPHRTGDIITLPYGISLPKSLTRSYQTAPIRLVYGGRVIQHQKRVLDFVPLVKNLLRQQVDFVFNIVGEGDELNLLRSSMLRIAPPDRVHFLGRVPFEQMAAIWAEHDVFVLVSEFEGTSVSMLEAMAQGVVPVVTQATSGIKEVVDPAKNGFVVPIGDMVAMAQVIAQLAADREQLELLGRAAQREALGYSMESYYAPKFIGVLDQALLVEKLPFSEQQPKTLHKLLEQERYGPSHGLRTLYHHLIPVDARLRLRDLRLRLMGR